MVDKKFLVLTLESNGEILEIGTDEVKIIEITGLEASDYELEINDYFGADGGYVGRKKILPREISLKAEFVDSNDNMVHRQRLIRFMNPKFKGILKVNYNGMERFIDYEIASFKDNTKNLYDKFSFSVDLICPCPYFIGYEILEFLTTWTGGLNFPLNLPFNLKQKGENLKNIYNEGHVDTPIEIAFKGPAVNPLIINKTTGEFIKVNRELTSEDILHITTEYRKKKVEIETNGIKRNAFNYIDLDSTFFSLKTGDNMIEYSTDSLEPLGVTIKYKNRYLGI